DASVSYVIDAKGIRKAYGGVQALQGCDFRVEAGTVHALLGENGAGKSTLVKILTGVVRQDFGEVLLDDKPVQFGDINDAARHGVAVVTQELNLFPDLDVVSNIFLGRSLMRKGIFNRKVMVERVTPVMRELGLEISPRALLGELTLAQQQLVEVAKALIDDPRVLILDEPTSALDDAASARLLHIVGVLRDRKVAVVFVSHILEEVMTLSNVITVLRDGQVVLSEVDRAELTIEGVVRAMVGDAKEVDPDVQAALPSPPQEGDGAGQLELKGIVVPGQLEATDLCARAGEIVGLAGVVGAGHRALLEVIAGVHASSAGQLKLPKRKGDWSRPPRSMRNAVHSGVAIVSGNRKRGLLFDRPIWDNIGQVRAVELGGEGIFIKRKKLRERAQVFVHDLSIKTSSVDLPVAMLSGGNQQKVVLAKWMDAEPSVLLLDDPTRGVAVGSKAEIHAMFRIACKNTIVLICSTDLDELVSLCDRVVVFRRGKAVAELSGEDLNRNRLLNEMNSTEDGASLVAVGSPE
ncbi:MAG: sugar ABC transporter ATP-binding protein, partial [Acidimicrobiales bacterium]